MKQIIYLSTQTYKASHQNKIEGNIPKQKYLQLETFEIYSTVCFHYSYCMHLHPWFQTNFLESSFLFEAVISSRLSPSVLGRSSWSMSVAHTNICEMSPVLQSVLLSSVLQLSMMQGRSTSCLEGWVREGGIEREREREREKGRQREISDHNYAFSSSRLRLCLDLELRWANPRYKVE